MRWVRIFKSWEDTCKALPENDPYQLKIGDRKVTVVRRKNELFAFEPLCPHQHEPLFRGTVSPNGEIICPLHSYRYNLKTGRECEQRTADLETFPIKVDNEVFLGID